MAPTLNNTPTGTGATNPTTGGTDNNLTPGTNSATPDNASNSSNVPPGGPTNSVEAAASAKHAMGKDQASMNFEMLQMRTLLSHNKQLIRKGIIRICD